MNSTAQREKQQRESPLHRDALHESALLHVTGEARYVDDLPAPPGLLVAWVLTSERPHAEIKHLDARPALSVPGVHAALTYADIPGVNDIAPVMGDEPLLAVNTVSSTGQAIALIVGESYEACRAGARAVELELEDRPACLSIEAAIEAGAFHGTPHEMRRGDVDAALAAAPCRFSGEIRSGGQDHFYLESQAAMAIPDEAGTLQVHSSTQHPSEVQSKVAALLGWSRNRIVVTARRMGGGFGGKETQAAHYGAMAALGAWVTGRPVKVWLDRERDMRMTGKRHPFLSRYEAGFSETGELLALRADCFSDGGWSSDLSGAILDRCLFHLDNSYYIPTLHFRGQVCRTNYPSNTAFRGFGGPQGMVVVEEVLSQAAERLQIEPSELRRRNFYGPAPRNQTPYHQEVPEDRSERIYKALCERARYQRRREEIDRWNKAQRWVKRGIGYQPVKFGISFTHKPLNQAGALVLLYEDGSAQLNHGGTEMGQGLHSKMLAIAAHELGILRHQIRVMDTATDKVPNTSATAASSGADLNGQAVALACRALIDRLRPIAASCFDLDEAAGAELLFSGGVVEAPDGRTLPFHKITSAAYEAQVSLAATGFYRTPGIGYDRAAGRGRPFYYYAYGAAVTEVEVNGLTGEHRVRAVDILHDVGNSLIPSIDRGQIEGAYIQGLGWLTREELVWADGALKTHSPDTYKIPAAGDAPHHFRVDLLDKAEQSGVIHGSKAVGEPPFMLAIGVLSALRQAIGGFASGRVPSL
ncbi:MAG: xanthine dehydrogenase molybdopterin binding subunit [Myxococcota bacterium]|nr:xanthine dehydrogenase molybdopterin binding subunit [Myxococcota bacterium]